MPAGRSSASRRQAPVKLTPFWRPRETANSAPSSAGRDDVPQANRFARKAFLLYVRLMSGCQKPRRPSARARRGYLLHQPGGFRFGLLEDRDVGVGVFPEAEEILVGSLCLCLGLISRHGERSAELQVCQGADGIADHDPAVIENLLEFRGGFGALVCRQIGQAPHIDWIEGPEVAIKAAARGSQLIGRGN